MFNIDSKINVYSKKESLFQLDKAFFFWEGGGRKRGEGGVVDLQWTNHRNWSKLLG